ncbi:MAG: Holliday junction resolvase RuvX [Patescibacteria group bacterium]|nr:Holliday junction resolvase RuvX [Patescibacteria group bacterium]MDD5554924.1 Holliday junction resolvase RuvX [Patescibacteria group bacterium]
MVRVEKKYLGVDWGEKRIGLALGDNETKLATPYKTVKGIDEILKVVKEEKIDVVVVGKPLKMSNIEYRISDEFSDFLSLLKKELKIPVETADERLSSKAADALPGNKKEKSGRDEIAAMVILQSYLDRHNRY